MALHRESIIAKENELASRHYSKGEVYMVFGLSVEVDNNSKFST